MKFFPAIVILAILLIAGCTQQQPAACTQEAKVCPDSSTVGRVPPNCDFSPCPPELNCSSFSVDQCPFQCVICPPCEVCSSISCQTEAFCTRIGFNRSWWESVRPKTCHCPEGYVQEGNVCTPNCYYSTPRCLMPSIQCVTASNNTHQ